MSPMSRSVGAAVSRIDGPLKVSGSAHYAGEFHEEGMVYGHVVPATIARGQVLSVDTAAAEAFPGVIRVYTHENRPDAASSDRKWKDDVAPPGGPLKPLEDNRILFDGQPVALVIAETSEAARDAASLIRVSYRVETPETDLEAHLDRAHEPAKRRNGIKPPPKPRGDAEAAFETAAHKIRQTYVIDPEHHNPMELFATTAFPRGEGKLDVHDKSQGSQASRDYVCRIFNLDPADVVVRNDYVGGAFGSGLRPKYQLFFAVMAALDLDRPVRVEMTRREMFYLTWRPTAVQTVSLGANRDGDLVSVMHHAVQATSRYEDYQEMIVNWSGLAYKCENAKLTYEIVDLDLSTPGDMRAPGAATGVTALEIAMDELAVEIGMDPLELRVRNFVHRDQDNDRNLTSKALHACYRQGAEAFGWSRRSHEPGSMIDHNDRVGWGMATGIWEAQVNNAEAVVRYAADGTVTVSAAATDIGTGTWTIVAQLAADAFDQPVEKIDVRIGDSTLATTAVAGGSWTAASTGTAVQLAADAVKATLLKRAQDMPNSPLKDNTPEETVIRDGRLVLDVNSQVGVSLAEIMAHHQLDTVEETGKAGPDLKQMMQFISYTHSAVFAEVKIDIDIPMPRVTRVVCAVAAGRIINLKTARSQILGGVVMGIGMALHEEGMVDHRTGRIMNHNLGEYHVPAHADIEDIEVIFVEEDDPLVSPIGVKGLGEIGIVGVAAAVVNAIHHATGKRVRHLPATLDKIMMASQTKEKLQ